MELGMPAMLKSCQMVAEVMATLLWGHDIARQLGKSYRQIASSKLLMPKGNLDFSYSIWFIIKIFQTFGPLYEL